MNLKLMLEQQARRYGEKPALVSGEHSLSYAQLDETSNKVANALTKMGVKKGDRVAMLQANSLESVAAYLGIVKIGAIAVPLDTKYKIRELASLWDDCQPKVLVTGSPFLEPLVSVLPRFEYIKHVIDLSSEYEGQFVSYREIMATSSAQRVGMELEPEDIALIAYTSGPTFYPRGVMLSHRSILAEAAMSACGFEQTDKDIVILFALPMHHVLGLVGILMTAIYEGSTVVIVPGVSIGHVMEIIEQEKATMFLAVPYIYGLAIHMAEKEGIKNDLNYLRLCGSAGAPLPLDTVRRFKQHYGLDIVDFWGLSEAVCHVTCQPLNGTAKLGSVGPALSGWQFKIVDDGDELPPHQPGEIIVRGPIMKGYYNNPQATAEAIRDGWLYTGDIGKVDEDGCLYILGRKKDMIIIKGQNVYPSDIEYVLSAHPKVAEAAVVGIPDVVRGEVIRAVIRLKKGAVATEQEIKHFCLERTANYKVPKQIIFVDSLPKTADGKIRKEELGGM